jgi:hypothetical protein
MVSLFLFNNRLLTTSLFEFTSFVLRNEMLYKLTKGQRFLLRIYVDRDFYWYLFISIKCFVTLTNSSLKSQPKKSILSDL